MATRLQDLVNQPFPAKGDGHRGGRPGAAGKDDNADGSTPSTTAPSTTAPGGS
jgi:hypothetical protein